MTDFLTQLRARQNAINAEIATHLAALESLTAELSDIAASGRMIATIAEQSTAPTAASDKPATAPAKHVAREPLSNGSGGVQDRSESTPPPNSAAPLTADDEGNIPALTAEVAPAASAIHSPEGASEEVGGFPVAATPHNVEQPADTKATREANLGTSSASSDATAAETAPASGGAPNEASPAPSIASRQTLRDRVAFVHGRHPQWTARMIANELGAPIASVSTYLASVRKEAKPAPIVEPFVGEAALKSSYADVRKRLGAAA